MNIRTLNYRPYHYQFNFHTDKNRWRIVAGGRRVGKSKMCVQECLKEALSGPNRTVYWIAPSYRLARDVGWEELQTHVDTLGPAIMDVNHSTMTMSFKNKSKISFRSGDNPDALRGRKLNLAILDEAAYIKPEIWQVIRPMLADTHGKAVLISTPNGMGNWFHNIFVTQGYWSRYHWPSMMNTEIMTPDELEDIKSNMSQTEYDQEILAKFVTRSGRVYTDFDESNILKTSFIIDKQKHDIHLGLDFGYAAPTAISFMAVDRGTLNKVWQFDEIYVTRTQMEDILKLVEQRLKEHHLKPEDIGTCYCDPAGEAYELSSGISPVDIMRKRGYTVINKATRIVPGIAQVRSFIKNASGNRRYFVSPNCRETIRSFQGYQYDQSKDGVAKEEALKDGLHDHMCDAVRYFFVNKFDSAKYVAKDVEQIDTHKQQIKKIVKHCTNCRKPFISNTTEGRPPFICEKCRG